MNLFEVYPLMDLEIESGSGSWVTDTQGKKYLDLYGGHAVISVGHSHPDYLERIHQQVERLGFYSNSVQNGVQKELARKLGELSSYPDYKLFLCNSGAEAVENALKLASFHTKKSEFIAFKGAFHGRTAAALAITDNPKIRPEGLATSHIHFVEFDQLQEVEVHLKSEKIAAVVIEGIQGVAGINVPKELFLQQLSALCKKYNALMILDEVQSGYGRTGDFFAHQKSEIQPDIITVAKGMGNGFPIGGVLIHPDIKASYGLLGTTFGGNHLACAAGLAVLEIIEKENLIKKTQETGKWLFSELMKLEYPIEISGRGLMLGLHFSFPIKDLRMALVGEGVLTGSAANPSVLRLLPPLNVEKDDLNYFLEKLSNLLNTKEFHDE